MNEARDEGERGVLDQGARCKMPGGVVLRHVEDILCLATQISGLAAVRSRASFI